MADDRDSLLREVEEELRREQMQKIWERYNGIIIGAAALIVAAVGGYQFLESRRISAAQEAGSEFAAAMQLSEDKKYDDALKSFNTIAQSGPGGYAALAKLHVAGTHAKAGQTAEAIAAYQSVIATSGADSLLKSFAELQLAALKIGVADYTEQQNRLAPLAADGAAFKTSAQELLGLSALKAGKLDEARKYFEPLLIDPQASRAIQERVKIVMAEIARAEQGTVAQPQAASDPAKASGAPATAPAAPAPAGDGKPADGTTDGKAAEPKNN